MAFDLAKLIFIVLGFGGALNISLLIKDKLLKIMSICVEVGFFVYSGIGLAFYSIDRAYLFIIQYILGAICFSFTIYSQQWQYQRYKLLHFNIDERIIRLNNGLFPKIFAIIYLTTFIFPFVYPEFNPFRIFNLSGFFSGYRALTSTYKLQLQNDGLYQLVCTTIRTLTLPWFYIYLSRIKNNPIKFITIYLIPVYLYAVSNYYISRNELAVFGVFIYIYLYKEKILPVRVLILLAVIGLPAVVVLFAELFYLRVGVSIASFNTITLVKDILLREINFVQNYSRTASLKTSVPTLMFFLYVTTCFIPMSLRSLFGVQEINMARILSNSILNMQYGDRNYYLILPSVLGEGIMLFDEYFAWIYLVIFALFLCWFLKRVSRDESMEYLSIYFIIDVVRQLRGGSQFILSSWTAAIIPLIIVMYILSLVPTKKRVLQ